MNSVGEINYPTPQELAEYLLRLEQLQIPSVLCGLRLSLQERAQLAVSCYGLRAFSRMRPGQDFPLHESATPPGLVLADSPLSVVTEAPRELPKLILTSGQERAWAKMQKFMASKPRLFVLKGYAGTGKTFLIQKLLESHSVLLTAPTNKAAKVMSTILGRTACTIYSLLGITMDAEEEELVLKYPDAPPKGIRGATIVIDECSMIGKKLLEFILKAAYDLDLKIIFVGDPAQLRPVGEERSPVWKLPVRPENKAMLTEVKRFDDQLLVVATAIRDKLRTKDYDIDLRDYADNKKAVYLKGNSFERVLKQSKGKARVLAWRNRTVEHYNDLVRSSLGFTSRFHAGDILLAASPIKRDGVIVATIDEEFKVQDTMRATIEDVECFNLQCMTVEETSMTLTVPTHGGRLVLDKKLAALAAHAKAPGISSWERKNRWGSFWTTKDRFNRVRYGFALTCHRAQGSTLGDVFVDQRDILANRESREAFQCLYVGCTRASDRLFFN